MFVGLTILFMENPVLPNKLLEYAVNMSEVYGLILIIILIQTFNLF